MTTHTITKTDAPQSPLAGTWRIDPTRSSVEFTASTLWGLVGVHGRFARYDGTLDLERSPAIELTIDADSIDTGMGLRDRHLRSGAFFDVDTHPEVRFVSDRTRLEGDTLKVRGRLYAAGQSLPLDLDASLRRVGDELQVEARTQADHRELGMSHGLLGMIPTPSQLTVRARLVR